MAHHIQRADGTVQVVGGYREKTGHAGTKKFRAGTRYASDDLPASVDLRPMMTAIEDQGQTSSCVANAVAGAYEYLAHQHRGEPYDVSRMFVYYNARSLEGDDIEDEGTSIHDAIAGLRKFGACAEETWPFKKSHVNSKPPSPAYDEAAEFVVDDTMQVPTDLEAWRHALAEGRPVIFGLTLFDSFDRGRHGHVPMPTEKETTRGKHGKHAMLAVGYSDTDEVFIVRNSWGTDWGDEGYCYIPYDYLMNRKLNSGDSWVITQLDHPPHDPQQHWGDDTSVLPDLEHELGQMDADEYQSLLEALGDVPLESRLALLYLAAAGADGELSGEEAQAVAEAITETLRAVGSKLHPEKVLRYATKHVGDEQLLEESIVLLGTHLSRGMLATLLNSLRAIAGADGLGEEEQEFIDLLVNTWEVSGDEDDTDDSDEDDTDESESADDSDEDDSDDSEDDSDDDDTEEDDSDEDDSDEDDSDDSDDSDDEDDEDSDDEDDTDDEDES